MDDLLHHGINVLFAIPAWLGPILFVVPAAAQLERGGTRRLWMTWAVFAVAFAFLATAGWYITPDRAPTPMAAIASQLVLVAPALAVTAAVLLLSAGTSLPRSRRLMLAGGAGTMALILCLTPAVLVSAALGGHEWVPC